MRRATLPTILLLSGCWPFIEGSWEDYYLPEDVQIVGTLSYLENQGDYWEGSDSQGTVWWGWLDEPTTTLSGFDLVAASQGCTVTPVDIDGTLSLMGDPGAEVAYLVASNDQTIELPWLDAEHVYLGQFTETAWTAGDVWDLAPIETEAEGKLSVEGFLVLPPELDIQSAVDFGGGSPPTGQASDLAFTWSGAEATEDDWFMIRAESVNAAGNTLEIATCITQLGRGELTVNGDVFTTTPAGWYVAYGPVTLSHSRVGSRDVSSSTSAAHLRVGYLDRS